MTKSQLAIGFLARERYSHAVSSLKKLVEHTPQPYNLIVVNNQYPDQFWKPVRKILDSLPSVTVINTPALTSANQSRNLIVNACQDDFLCLLENDVEVSANWLPPLLKVCKTGLADVVVPLLLEPLGTKTKVHFDDRLGRIKSHEDSTGTRFMEILPREGTKEEDRNARYKEVDFIEMHFLFFRTRVFEKLGEFDASQRGSRQEVDLSLALHKKGIKAVLQPESTVTFYPPPPIYSEEREFFMFIWDLDASKRDADYLVKKWNLQDCPESVKFTRSKLQILENSTPKLQIQNRDKQYALLHHSAEDLKNCIPAGEQLILVDNQQWRHSEIAPGYKVCPFTEKDGQFWGNPSDDDAAISELERLRTTGRKYLVFGNPGFWWLDFYKGFHDYLREKYKCIFENERLVVFDLERVRRLQSL